MRSCKSCSTPLKNKRSFYCNSKCLQDLRYKEYIERWKLGLESGSRGIKSPMLSAHVERYIFQKYNNKCARCEWSQFNLHTGTLPLEIDHIDGNFQNNKEENLILICPNCHALTKPHKGANRGNGRYYRKQRYHENLSY